MMVHGVRLTALCGIDQPHRMEAIETHTCRTGSLFRWPKRKAVSCAAWPLRCVQAALAA